MNTKNILNRFIYPPMAERFFKNLITENIMSHSLTKIWIHGVFGTKDHQPLLSQEFEMELHNHIRHSMMKDFDCYVKSINGINNHIHILFLLNPNYACSDIFKNIKGESSHWWNQQKFTKIKFAWQTGYGAFSVSESMIAQVDDYVKNQKEHHLKLTYGQEVEAFIKKYGLQIINR